jgi:hypothetical protein
MAPARPTNTTAIIALVSGILGLTLVPFLGSIVAVIVGGMAKKEIAASAGAAGGEGLAQIGVILGWVGIGLGVLAACAACAVFVLPFVIGGAGILSTGDFGSALPAVLALA